MPPPPVGMANSARWRRCLLAQAAWLCLSPAAAQLVISDNMSGRSASMNWLSFGQACLTAGDGSGTVPGCFSGSGGVSGSLPDPVGRGALRLTHAALNAAGAVVSDFTFPSNKGLQVTFTTMTYGGNGLNGLGADGISFYLTDGAERPSVGSYGGSLGYACAPNKSPGNGVVAGYLGVGIDEYGNFSNPSDVATTGPGFVPNAIVVRGAGSVTSAAGCTPASGSPYRWLTTANLLPGQAIANQQNMFATRGAATPISYTITLSEAGMLNVFYNYNGTGQRQIITNMNMPAVNGPMPATFRFGFAASTGGGTNHHEISCFRAGPQPNSTSSAASNTAQSRPMTGGAQAYFAYNHPQGNWGQLTANTLRVDAAGNPSIAPVANWDAHCVLTGTGARCEKTGVSGPTPAQPPHSSGPGSGRQLLTWEGQGRPFTWTNVSPGSPLRALTAGDPSATGDRLNYLRGVRSGEVAAGGTFRTRMGVLGNIANSSPVWVGAPSQPYSGSWRDALHPQASAPEDAAPPGGDYLRFKTTYATRTHVVYVGANDGFLHAFRAGAADSTGAWVSSAAAPNDGYELLGYMPAAALATIRGNVDASNSSTSAINPTLDFSSPNYTHAYFVDATPSSNDLFVNGQWRTWLVGRMGAGGNYGGSLADNNANNQSMTPGKGAGGSLYVLDITDPSRFSEGQAAALVVADWTPASLRCVSGLSGRTAADQCGRNLGNGYGTPLIRRLHDGNWAILYGNGLNSASGASGLYITRVDSQTGALNTQFLDTGTGTESVKSGIVEIAPVDLDGDRIIDYVYAGDVLGKVWRFDLSSRDPAAWRVRPTPVFSTQPGQPITTSIAVSPVNAGAKAPRVMLNFGTGQKFPLTPTHSEITYAGSPQALYGIWDWDFGDWNAKGSTVFASMPSLSGGTLLQQTQTAGVPLADGTSTLAGTTRPTCWIDTQPCTSGNSHYGWTMPLPAVVSGSGATAVTNYEQVVYNPTTQAGAFVVNTSSPSVSDVITCTSATYGGATLALDRATGSPARPPNTAPPATPGAPGGSGFFYGSPDNTIGVRTHAVGTPFFVTDSKGRVHMGNQVGAIKADGSVGDIRRINLRVTYTGERVNYVRQR